MGGMKSRWWGLLLVVLMLLGPVPALAQSGDITLYGDELLIESGQTHIGNVTLLGGSVKIAEGGSLVGDLLVVRGKAEIAGTVSGTVVAIAGETLLHSTSVIDGDLVYSGGRVRQSPGSTLRGDLVGGPGAWTLPGGFLEEEQVDRLPEEETPMGPPLVSAQATEEPDGFARALKGVLRFVGGLVFMAAFGVLLLSVVPGPVTHVSEVIREHPLPAVGVGLLTLIAAAILVPLLTILIVTIPLAFLIVLAGVAAGLVGWVAVALQVGQFILSSSGVSRMVKAIAGIVVLALVSNIPCLGFLVSLGAVAWGIGAVVLTRFGTSGQQLWEPFAGLAGRSTTRAEAQPAATPWDASGVPSASEAPEDEPALMPLDVEEPAPHSRDETRRLDGLDDTLPEQEA
ncbi:MAG: hypothetical protein ACOX2L_03695 [Anaerolineae bacterium]|nr:EscU/YscU/HrcU family type III secretion system export apparatus switch protein [Chloroflexota bacterium]